MNRVFDLMVVGQPVSKGRPRVTFQDGKAHGYNKPVVEDYTQLVATLMKEKANLLGYKPFSFPAPVRVTCQFIIKDRKDKKPDVNNMGALILDAIKGICYDDDAQVTELHLFKRPGNHPRAYIHVQEASRLETR